MPTQLTPTSGISATPQAAAADATGNYIVPGAAPTGVVIRVNNASAGTVTVTLDDIATTTPEGGSAAAAGYDVAVSIPAGAARYIVIPRAKLARFINPANGRVTFTASPVTSVTIDVVGVV